MGSEAKPRKVPRRWAGTPGMLHGHPSHVGLVDDRAVPGRAGRTVVLPGERRIDDDGLGHGAGRVARVEGEVLLRVADRVAEEVVAPVDRPADRFGVGIDEELAVVEAVPGVGLVGAVDLVAVERARAARRGGRRARPGRSSRSAGSRWRARPTADPRTVHSWTASACSEKSAKLTPSPSHDGAERVGGSGPDPHRPLVAVARRPEHPESPGIERNGSPWLRSPRPSGVPRPSIPGAAVPTRFSAQVEESGNGASGIRADEGHDIPVRRGPACPRVSSDEGPARSGAVR